MSFIVPGKTLIELMKFLNDSDEDEVNIRIGGKHALFNIDNTAPARHSGTITYTFIPQ